MDDDEDPPEIPPDILTVKMKERRVTCTNGKLTVTLSMPQLLEQVTRAVQQQNVEAGCQCWYLFEKWAILDTAGVQLSMFLDVLWHVAFTECCHDFTALQGVLEMVLSNRTGGNVWAHVPLLLGHMCSHGRNGRYVWVQHQFPIRGLVTLPRLGQALCQNDYAAVSMVNALPVSQHPALWTLFAELITYLRDFAQGIQRDLLAWLQRADRTVRPLGLRAWCVQWIEFQQLPVLLPTEYQSVYQGGPPRHLTALLKEGPLHVCTALDRRDPDWERKHLQLFK